MAGCMIDIGKKGSVSFSFTNDTALGVSLSMVIHFVSCVSMILWGTAGKLLMYKVDPFIALLSIEFKGFVIIA